MLATGLRTTASGAFAASRARAINRCMGPDFRLAADRTMALSGTDPWSVAGPMAGLRRVRPFGYPFVSLNASNASPVWNQERQGKHNPRHTVAKIERQSQADTLLDKQRRVARVVVELIPMPAHLRRDFSSLCASLRAAPKG